MGIEPVTTRCLVVALSTKLLGQSPFRALKRRAGLGFACFASQKREKARKAALLSAFSADFSCVFLRFVLPREKSTRRPPLRMQPSPPCRPVGVKTRKIPSWDSQYFPGKNAQREISRLVQKEEEARPFTGGDGGGIMTDAPANPVSSSVLPRSLFGPSVR